MRYLFALDRKNIQNSTNITDFIQGLKSGIPIALGYIPVSFTFGLMAVSGGLSPWMALFISMSNLTSAGQFAGTNLIISGTTMVELMLTTFIINIRYMLMSLALSQKVNSYLSTKKRCLIAFGITDETFTIASMKDEELTYSYMLGLITGPYLGWALGTFIGAFTCSILPSSLQNSMGIALYAMFIALVVPQSKKSKAVLIVTLTSICISSILTWIRYFTFISQGWKIIIATIIGATFGAIFFPQEDEKL